MKRQHWSSFLIGLLSGLLAAGFVLLFLARPRRYPIQLLPAPTPAPIRVHVAGAVLNPDVYFLPVGSILESALETAGGSLQDADLNRVNLAAPLEDGQQIFIPFRVAEASSNPSTAPAAFAADELIDINQATAAELEQLPGIGPSLAQSIVEYRLAHGLFLGIDDLLNVSGIGPAKLEQIRDRIRTQ
ncbi:MAG: ComEA family DNA-binding protein [Anaerolineales bacterium]|nr:MAG: ComEA family DNA-binding protein [Anaerolineales bacterium]